MNKNKEPVALRSKKLKDGSESLYLDIYVNGKRQYEFLKLYITPGTDRVTRDKNKSTMQAAYVMKTKRIVELQNGKYGITTTDKSITFVDYWKRAVKEKALSKSQTSLYDMALLWWKRFDGEKTPLSRVTTQMLADFSIFLQTAPSRNSDKIKEKDGSCTKVRRTLKGSTARVYFECALTILARAYEKGVIRENPASGLEKGMEPKYQSVERQFLTKEELEKMIATKCKRKHVKQAFLFACFTGLRKSDISALRWYMVNGDTISLRMKKTREMIYIPLSENAKRWLPERGKDDEPVFSSDGIQNWCRITSKWAKDAGVNKHIPFHCARHTFATMLLTYGADITVVSKLLGHHDLATTLIYAKIVDKRKVDAVNMIPKI